MFICFPHATIVKVTGAHAARYLQNRLSNDIKSISVGLGSCVAAALSAQGKIQAIFTVLAETNDQYLLISEAGDSEEILARLAQFKVAERVEFIDISSQYMLLGWEAPLPEEVREVFPELHELPPLGRYVTSLGTYLVGQRGLAEESLLCIIPKDRSTSIHAEISRTTAELGGDALKIAKIRRNMPSFPDELGQELLLSETPLSHAVSFTKGCYVGQEVVAKIDALGRAPRQLVPFAISGKHLDLVDAPVTQEHDSTARSFGRVLSAVFDPLEDETVGFLVVKNDPAVLQSSAPHSPLPQVPLCANGRPLSLLRS